MARKLKSFITNLGFFELAVAAPSMEAALEAWGMSHNAFQHGFARQTDDAAIIAATQAKPGVVLKRAVGSDVAFSENAALPKNLPALDPPKLARPTKKAKKAPKAHAKQDRAAVISFEKARAKREKERAREEARQDKERAQRKRETDKSQSAFDDASERHEAVLAEIAEARDKLDRREARENERWAEQHKRLKAGIDRARD